MESDSVSDELLVRRVQQGKLDAFEELLNRHSSSLRAFIAMKLPIPHLIDEIAHECFIFAHRRISDFEAGTDFNKWLRAIAYNLVRRETLRHQRNKKNQENFLEHCLIQRAGSGEVTAESPMMVYLEECLQRLPDRQLKLLKHRYTFVESSREISRNFRQSDAWVRTNLSRIRSTLRKCIEDKLAFDSV